ncbi:TPA: recombinase family protein, partial [Escherichia coli]
MIFGYARVSTKDQNLERQLAVLEPVCDKIVAEKESGKS